MKSEPPANSSADDYQSLAGALRKRLALIADRELYRQDPAAHLGQLQLVSETISSLAARLPPDTDLQLAHYLQRCSYDKALALIEGR